MTWEIGVISSMEKVAFVEQLLAGQLGPQAARADIKRVREAAQRGHPAAKYLLKEIKQKAKKIVTIQDPKAKKKAMVDLANEIRGASEVFRGQRLRPAKSISPQMIKSINKLKLNRTARRGALGLAAAGSLALLGRKIYKDMRP